MRDREDDSIPMSLIFRRETDLAIHVSDGADGHLVWLPKSRIEYDGDDHNEGDVIDVIVPGWLVRKTGLA
jgi:hypothetical protein